MCIHYLELMNFWTASMELYELRSGRNLFDLHLAAIDGGTAPGDRPGAIDMPRFLAKAILYAIEPVTAPDPALLEAIGARDRPRAGERFLPGQPLCTLLADGADRDACLRSLRSRCDATRLLLQARRPLPPAGAAAGRA